MVCKLNKALYSLKQLPQFWYQRFSSFLLIKLSLTPINANHNTSITGRGLKRPIMSTFVDDIKIMGPKSIGLIVRVKKKLPSTFEMVDIRPISFYLDLNIEQDWENRTIKLSQLVYIQKVLAKYDFDKANRTKTLMKEIALGPRPNLPTKAIQAEEEKYQRITGSLMFSIVDIRPDIAFSITVSICFTKNPSHSHFEVVKSILRYLKRSINFGITYSRDKKLIIKGYSNFD